MRNCLTIDVEDWFCVEAFSDRFPLEVWNKQKTRVLSNLVRTLEILDDYNVKGTFFVLGWIAEKFPEIVDYLSSHGHEIGSHSYVHKLVYKMSPQEFEEDTLRSLEAIRKGGNVPVLGYRAPSFSIRPELEWTWEILARCGFAYDSSVFPVSHDIYGAPKAPRFAHRVETSGGNSLMEIPPATIRIFGKNFGVAGGGYLRLFPLWFTDWAISRINRLGFPAVVYFHPWEIDINQPRQKAGLKSRFRHYTNLGTVEIKLRKLLKKYEFGTIKDVFKLDKNQTADKNK